MYDVAIIGAGPAGATLARLLSERYRVLLVDRRRLDLEPRAGALTKPCGGLLAPAAQRELARQGLGVDSSVVTGRQLFAVRTLT
jgi:flavin-dependent dehydrogenase